MTKKKTKRPRPLGVSRWTPGIIAITAFLLIYHLGWFDRLGIHGFLWEWVAMLFVVSVIEALSWRILGPEIRVYEQEKKQRFATGAPTAAETRERFLRSFRA